MWGLGAMVTLTVIGVVGFMLVAAASPLDALYMTVVTLSTVGYNEVVPLDQGGRIFAIALIIAGIGTIGYTGVGTVEYLVSGHLLARAAQRRKEQALTALRGHYIVCGSGRVGQGMIENLGAAGRSVVTIDRDPARCERAEGLGVLTVCGNAASAETRRTAGIDRATAVLVSMGNHADNVYTMLSARATAPHIPVIARANADETVDRLALAGAYVDRTIGEVGLRQHGVKVMAIGRDGEQQFLPARDEKTSRSRRARHDRTATKRAAFRRAGWRVSAPAWAKVR